ncbi:MAG: helix-turn-helix domain-containing protein [Ktedonobacterales bacterium]|nr:helix-turn-helix domain-containing protein [Ktedonobacterales bacterium]
MAMTDGDDEWLTPREAALRCQVPERTVVFWINTGRLVSEVRPRGARRRHYVRQQDLQGLIDQQSIGPARRRTTELERQVAELSSIVRDMQRQLRQQGTAVQEVPPPSIYLPPPAPVAQRPLYPSPARPAFPATGSAGIRANRNGLIRVMAFAKLHNVSPGTLKSQIDRENLDHMAMPTNARDGRRERWLTPQQQDGIIAFWLSNSTQYDPCPQCPRHGPSAHDDLAELDRELDALSEEEG